VADGVQKLEARVCAGVQTIDAGLDPRIILHVALLLGTTDAHSIADPRQVRHVVSGNVLQLFQEREQFQVRDSYSATKTCANTMKTLCIQQFWKHSTACHYCYSFPAKKNTNHFASLCHDDNTMSAFRNLTDNLQIFKVIVGTVNVKLQKYCAPLTPFSLASKFAIMNEKLLTIEVKVMLNSVPNRQS